MSSVLGILLICFLICEDLDGVDGDWPHHKHQHRVILLTRQLSAEDDVLPAFH